MATLQSTPVVRPSPEFSVRRLLQRTTPHVVLIGRIIFLGLIVVVWHWVATATLMSSTLSTPWETVSAFGSLLTRGTTWSDIGITLRSAMLGLLISAVIGILFGLLIGLSRTIYSSTSFVVDFLRTIPGLAVIPLGILVFGPTLQLDLFMIMLSAIWPILIQTEAAVRQIDRETLDTARSYMIPAWRRMFFIMLPAASPRIATGLRIAATMSLLLAIGTQLIAGSPGLGNRISVYQQNASYAEMFACILIAGMLGILINFSLKWVETRTLKWHFIPRRNAQMGGN